MRTTPTARPTPSLDDRRTELELRKLDREGDVLGAQDQLLQAQREQARQIWRAPAEFISMVGPTAVGAGLLFLAARALSHFLPAPPPKPEQPLQDEAVEDEDL